jgi:hypothetical protein
VNTYLVGLAEFGQRNVHVKVELGSISLGWILLFLAKVSNTVFEVEH